MTTPERVPDTAPSPTPFTMIQGDPNALACEGDACVLPSSIG